MKERETRIRFKNDFPFFAHNCLNIRPKDGGLVDLRLNQAQRFIHEKIELQKKEFGYVKAIILKGRQQGCSTYVGARFFWKVIHYKGIKSFILTHRGDATDNLFKMTQRYYQYLPDKLKPFVDRKNAKELSFTLLDSGYKVGTAGSGAVGRSDTIQLFHGSEVAFWECADEIVSGVMQAIPRDSEIILESTARGMGNFFHKQWAVAERGESDFVHIFIPWFWQDEYSLPLDGNFKLSDEEIDIRDLYKLSNEQIYWRQKKVTELGEPLFKQEYPLNPQEAFLASFTNSFIGNDLVERARKCPADVKPYGPVIIGVDPSRNEGNGDRTGIICRQGRVAFDLKWLRTNDLMEIVGIVHGMIKKYNAHAVCVDVIGLGSGIVDRLRELGFERIVKPINCTNTAYDSLKYKDKKAESWGEMREWLEDWPCKIPDDDSLHTDLCCVGWTYDSKNRFKMHSKDKIRENGFDSPDLAEALANTFAFPFHTGVNSSVKPYSSIENIWSR